MPVSKSRLMHVLCAISGGVDSAVAAHLLLKQGHKVTGCHMTNWDTRADDTTLHKCPQTEDAIDAQRTCDRLGIEMVHVNYTEEYWTQVFEHVIQSYSRGRTPNPDILCNRFIKFDRLLHDAEEKFGCEALATGHYARVRRNTRGDELTLCTAIDALKDQTYFLAGIQRSALSKIRFPVGHLLKHEVKRIAVDELGLEFLANKKESMGICFVGKRRSFSSFLRQYIPPSPGDVVDITSNAVLHRHSGIHNYTIGQRFGVGVASVDGRFVCKIDAQANIVYVAPHKFHASMYATSFDCSEVNWLSTVTAAEPLHCTVVYQRQFPVDAMPCTVTWSNDRPDSLHVKLRFAAKSLVPGQFAVFYRDNECLGGACIAEVARSLYERQHGDRSNG